MNRWLIALAGISALLGAARLAINVEHGLGADYFDELDARAAPMFHAVDRDISTEGVTESWFLNPPPAFHVRWSGFLTVAQTGSYAFALTSDDGSTLSVDGRVLVDNGGRHGSQTRTGAVHLERGAHSLLVEFANEVGGFDIAWQWSRDGTHWTGVPSWQLSTRAATYARVVAARVLDWSLGLALAITLVLAAPRLLRLARSSSIHHPRTACLLFFIVLTVAETWPLAAHPREASRNNSGDAILTEWIISWVAHQAPRDPLHLYAANIFYPHRRALAFSESMILQSAVAAPFLWLGASPVLAFNLVLLTGFALSGWTMSLAVRHWTDDWVAGLASGILFAFNAHVFTRMPQLQAQQAEFLPLAVLATDTFLRDPRGRQAIRLAVFVTLQSLASVYLMVFTATAVVVGVLVRPETWWGPKVADVAKWLVAAGALTAVLLAPYLWPYWVVRQEQGAVVHAEAFTTSGADWAYYLSTPSRIDFALFSHRYFVGVALFPGVLALVLAAIALVSGAAFRKGAARMCLAIGLCGLALSFGSAMPGFVMLRRAVPLFQIVRDVPRYGYLVIFAVAALAGFGVAVLRRYVSQRWWPGFAACLLTLLAIEQGVAPIGFQRFGGIPSIYGQLQHVDGAVAIEMPIYSRIASFHNAPYMLNATANWKPLVNGYSGFEPLGYRDAVERYAAFPAESAVSAMQAAGITHVFVHLAIYGDGIVDRLAQNPVFHQLARKEGIALYRLDPLPGAR